MADIPELVHSTQPTADASQALLNDANAAQKSYLQTGVDAVVDRTLGHDSTVGGFLSHHVPEFLQTAALFTPGRVGMAASVFIGAANGAKMGDSFTNQLGDASLGAVKGGLTKFVFAKIGDTQMHPSFLAVPLKGVSMGLAGRGIDLALTKGTWTQGQVDGKTGVSSIVDNVEAGVSHIATNVFNKQTMILDAGVFALSGIGSGVINTASRGLLDSSVIAKTVVNGVTFGASSGGMQEIGRQQQAGKGFDWSKIAAASATSALIDGLAAAPGGYYGSRPTTGGDGSTNDGAKTSPDMSSLRRGFALATLLSLTSMKLGSTAMQRSPETTEPLNPEVGMASDQTTPDYHTSADGSVHMRFQFPVALKAGDKAVFDNTNGSITGAGKVELIGNSQLHLEVPDGNTMRLVIKGEDSFPTVSVADASKGLIELVNQRQNDTIPAGLLDATGAPRADVRVLDPLADLFSAQEIENIRAVQEEIYGRKTPEMTEQEMRKVADEVYKPAGRQERIIQFVMGPPGAGKTSGAVGPLAQKHAATVVDGDAINPKVPGYDNGLGQVPVGAVSKIIRVMVLKQAMDNGDNIVFPVLGHRLDVMEAMIDDARAQGYKVGLHLIDLSPEESARRVYIRTMMPVDPLSGIRQVIDPEWALLRLGGAPAKVFDELISRPGYIDEYTHFHSDVPFGEPYVHIRSSSTTASNVLYKTEASTTTSNPEYKDGGSTTTTATTKMPVVSGTAGSTVWLTFPSDSKAANEPSNASNDNPGLSPQPQPQETDRRAAAG